MARAYPSLGAVLAGGCAIVILSVPVGGHDGQEACRHWVYDDPRRVIDHPVSLTRPAPILPQAGLICA
jgi:hypothetical protein